MYKAKSYFLKEDLANAKIEYTEALRLKPTENEPKMQLKTIEDKLNALTKVNETDTKYDQKIALGDSLLIAKLYDNASDAYKAALIIKPGQYYPQKQISYCYAENRNLQKEKEDRAKLELYQKQKESDLKFRDVLKRADQAVTDKNYALAKAAYIEVLTMRPDYDYAKQRLDIVTFQLEKANIAEAPKKYPKQDIENKPVIIKKKNAEIKTADSEMPIPAPAPYSPEELKTKYPDIDFTKLPPEQPFNGAAGNASGKAPIIRQMLSEAPRLDLFGSEGKYKLTCQAINYEGTDVYFKFLIKNNSASDFLTGAMMVTWTKRAGNKIKLYPVYLYPAFLPIITPGNEAIIIYVCKSYFVNDQEKLDVEFKDRLNKIKLEIKIPGTIYNEEEARD